MDDTTIPLGGHPCPECHHVTHVREDGMLYWHRRGAAVDGHTPAPWCEGGGLVWDGSRRLEEAELPLNYGRKVTGKLIEEMGTTLPEVNPRLVRVHLWCGVSYPVQLPGSFFSEEATPPGEGLQSYAWLAFVTKQLHAFVGSTTAAYRIAKVLHQARWPAGTPELPAGTLVRRRLEREAGS